MITSLRTLNLAVAIVLLTGCATTGASSSATVAASTSPIARPTIAIPTELPELQAWAAVRRALPAQVPVFRPGWLPDRFRTGNPVVEFAYFQGAEPTGRYRVGYRDAQGKVALFAIGPVNSGPPLSTEPTSVRGVSASLSVNDGFPAIQLQWTEQGAPYSIQSTGLTRDELLHVAQELVQVTN